MDGVKDGNMTKEYDGDRLNRVTFNTHVHQPITSAIHILLPKG